MGILATCLAHEAMEWSLRCLVIKKPTDHRTIIDIRSALVYLEPLASIKQLTISLMKRICGTVNFVTKTWRTRGN